MNIILNFIESLLLFHHHLHLGCNHVSIILLILCKRWFISLINRGIVLISTLHLCLDWFHILLLFYCKRLLILSFLDHLHLCWDHVHILLLLLCKRSININWRWNIRICIMVLKGSIILQSLIIFLIQSCKLLRIGSILSVIRILSINISNLKLNSPLWINILFLICIFIFLI